MSSLTGTITHGNDTWLVDSDASKHMTGYKDFLIELVEKESHQKVKLGDDYQYLIKGVGEASYKLESGKKTKDEGCFVRAQFKEESSLHFRVREERVQSCFH